MTSFILAMMIIIINFSLYFAAPTTIYINSVEDFIDFSKNATLDSYFNDKTVVLEADIDLSRQKDFQVPTFAGVFDGQGHTISGLSITDSGSTQGLFRYLQENGVIKNLNIKGKVTPSGSQNVVGGLVGNNKGSIKQVSFDGQVSGKNNIGGLVGINEATGTISHAKSKGEVTGEHFTGGIVGQNLGTILKATNSSEVNTTIAETTVSVESVNWSQINSTENISAHTDTGGIAGFSSGYIQDSINRGPIGYKYMGYNVGGIVGRQSGYLNNCQNYHTVLGRKDIGGIVGQIEPHLILLFSEDTLQKLNKELNLLQTKLNNTFDHSGDSSKAISGQISGIGESLDDTRDLMQVLSRGTVDYVDDVTDTVNITGDRIRYTLEEIISILDEATETTQYLNKGIDNIEVGFDELEITSNKMSDALDTTQTAMKSLRKSVAAGEDAIYQTEKALKNLLDTIESTENRDNIAGEIESAINNIANSFTSAGEAIGDIANALKNPDDVDPGFSHLGPGFQEVANSLGSISGNLSKMSKNISQIIEKGIAQTTSDIKKDLDTIFYDLKRASARLGDSIGSLEKSFDQLEETSDQSAKAFSAFSDGFHEFSHMSESLTAGTTSIRNLIDSLVEKPDIELPNISSEYRQSGEDLFDVLQDISTGINDLHMEIKDAKEHLVRDIEAVGDQVVSIFSLLIEAREDIGESEYIEDISDESIENAKQGVVYKNQNYGSVKGSVNIGGIVGTMAMEFDIDPENDIFETGTPSLNFKYLTTAIVKECINNGKVTGKKDHTGGIAGRMDIGIVTACENYGDIESKEGDYVGGIAGACHTSIDKSFALSTLSGKDYIGGLAGYANNISNSYAMVDIRDGVENIGSIAGQAEGDLSNNHYVHETIAAIDGISYSHKASPLSYEALLAVEGLPEAFTQFAITFIADGNVLEIIPFEYGDSFDLSLLPEIPAKAEHDHEWDDFKKTNMVFNMAVEAIYTPIKTVLSSSLSREDDTKPLVLVEGKFRQDVRLEVSPVAISKEASHIPNNETLETWEIALDGLEDSNISPTIRLLMPEEKTKVKVWQSTDDGWEKLDASISGSYIVFPMDGSSGIFQITQKNFSWIGALGILVTIAILGIIKIFWSRSRRQI